MAENFQNTVGSLFKGMEEFITTKTVVGDPVTVGDTIIVPLVDVSFGVGASAKTEEKKNSGGGGMGGFFLMKNPRLTFSPLSAALARTFLGFFSGRCFIFTPQ